MTAKVVVEEGKRSRVIELPAKTRVTIGRSPSSCLIVIEDIAASREHAALELRGDRWYVLDLQSKNGTRLNGEAISGPAIRLEPGDKIEIGLAKMTFLDVPIDPGLEESSGLSSFARSLGPNEPRPSTEERILPRRAPVDAAADAIFAAMAEGQPLMEVLDAVEREVLARALADANGNRSEAARKLQLSRPGMLKKMKRHGIH